VGWTGNDLVTIATARGSGVSVVLSAVLWRQSGRAPQPNIGRKTIVGMILTWVVTGSK